MAQGILERHQADGADDQAAGGGRAHEARSRRHCLILGGAPAVLAEYDAARSLIGQHHVIAVNDAGVLFQGPLLAWATLHPEKLGAWRAARRGSAPAETIAHVQHADSGGLTRIVPDRWGGSSGLYAVQIALEVFQFRRVVVCGVPMDGRFGHVTGAAYWPDADVYQRGWLRARPHITDCVRSMSGWTRELFGSPTPDWSRGT